MKSQLNVVVPGVFNNGLSLQQLVNRLVSSSKEMALLNKVVVVNEVPGDLIITADENKVVPVIDELLTAVVANGKNSSVYVSADRYRDIIILNIQDRNNNNGYALDFSIMSMEPQATEAGGSITIEGKQKKVATISFSFPIFLQQTA
jgi:hypothetical protein